MADAAVVPIVGGPTPDLDRKKALAIMSMRKAAAEATPVSRKTNDKPSALSQIGHALKPIADVPREIGKDYREGVAKATDAAKRGPDKPDPSEAGGRPPIHNDWKDVAQWMGGEAQAAFAPVTGTVRALFTNPAKKVIPQDSAAGRMVVDGGEIALQMLGPGAFFKAGGEIVKMLPKLDQSVTTLMDAGVKLTPGQIGQGIVRKMESAGTSAPILGQMIDKAQGRSLIDFNRAVINKSLDPIGVTLPKGVDAGPKAIAFAQKAIGDKYDRLLPKLTFKPDRQLMTDIAGLKLSMLPPGEQVHFQAIMNDAKSRLNAQGVMDGQTWKDVDAELGFLGRRYARSDNPAQAEFGERVVKMQGFMRDALERSNPMYQHELENINSAWAIYKRAEGASVRRVKSHGVFTGADLLSDIRNSTSQGTFARGDGMMQSLATAADTVLPSNIPDSGTAGRLMWRDLLMSGVGASAGEHYAPQMTTGLLAAGAIGAAPYTKVGGKVVNAAAKLLPR